MFVNVILSQCPVYGFIFYSISNFTIGKLGIVCDYKLNMLAYVTFGKLGISNFFYLSKGLGVKLL